MSEYRGGCEEAGAAEGCEEGWLEAESGRLEMELEREGSDIDERREVSVCREAREGKMVWFWH